MNTYKIRVHNGYYFMLVILPAMFIPLAGFFLPGGVSINDYMMSHGYINWNKYFPCYYILFILSVFTIFYYDIYDFIDVKVSNDGVSTKWRKGYSFSTKTEREIRWDEIKNVDYLLTAYWWDGITITTTDNKKFSIASLSLLVRQKQYKAFLKDFESHYDAYKNKQSQY